MNPIIGLRDLVTAELLTDTTEELTYDTVEPIEGLIDVTIDDDSPESEGIYADNVEKFTLLKSARVRFTVELLAAQESMIAKIFGHTYTNQELIKKDTDSPPYRAFGFKAEDGAGGEDGVWLKKCRPVGRTNSMTYHTKEGENTTVQTVKIDFIGIPTVFDKEYQQMVNSLDTDGAEIWDDWFDNPPVEGGE